MAACCTGAGGRKGGWEDGEGGDAEGRVEGATCSRHRQEVHVDGIMHRAPGGRGEMQ